MQPEYEAIAASGLNLQLDSPDLAMAGHSGSVGSDLTNLQEHIEQAIGVLNDATQAIPPEQMRLHVCWGNYAGPHHKDVPLRDIVRPILETRAQAIYVEAANPRHAHEWEVWNEVAAATRQGPDRRRYRRVDQPHRASAPGGAADSAVREPGRSRASDCGHGLRLRDIRRLVGV